MNIKKYLIHKVDIVRITIAKGIRSETMESDVSAFITQKTSVIRDEAGEHFGTGHLIFFAGDVTLDEDDELIIDGKQRPITDIFKVRDTSNIVRHLEVEVS